MSLSADDIIAGEQLVEQINQAIEDMRNLAFEFEGQEEIADEIDDLNIGEPLPLEDAELGRVVTVDAAIMALHLVAARITFRTWSQALQVEITKVANYGNSALSTASTAGFFGRAGQIIGFISKAISVALNLVSLFHADVLRLKVRDAGHLMRGELAKLRLTDAAKRCTSYVSTRHYSPPQRKKNKGWRPC